MICLNLNYRFIVFIRKRAIMIGVKEQKAQPDAVSPGALTGKGMLDDEKG